MAIDFNALAKEIEQETSHEDIDLTQESFTGLNLTDDQTKALSAIVDWLEIPDSPQYKTLMGYAGTGKTTLLNEVAHYAMNKNINAIFTAPTNKAVKVLMERIEYKPPKFSKSNLSHDKSNSPNFSTIHSLLNIKPKREKSKEVFEPVKWNKKDIEQYDLVVVDECSMVSEKLLGYLEEQMLPHIKVLFCGDPAQLQPVNEEKSKCFEFEPEMLSEIVRHGDTIAQVSKTVRSTDEFVDTDLLIEPPDVSYISVQNLVKNFQNFRKNPDRIRMICWTNDRVRYWNHKLRLADYGKKHETPFVAGDIIIANAPAEAENDQILMNNSEEGLVVEVHEQEKSWDLIVEKFSGGEVVVRKIKDWYIPKHKKALNHLAEKEYWTEFWKQKKMYHDIRHCYALTAHKAQGSTFENVVIDVKDVNRNYTQEKQYEERNQLLYVAITRASKNVYFY